jgi:hypothetical protein
LKISARSFFPLQVSFDSYGNLAQFVFGHHLSDVTMLVERAFRVGAVGDSVSITSPMGVPLLTEWTKKHQATCEVGSWQALYDRELRFRLWLFL